MMQQDAIGLMRANDGWAAAYLGQTSGGDLFADAAPDMAGHWNAMLDRLAAQGKGDPAKLAEHVARQAKDLGLSLIHI